MQDDLKYEHNVIVTYWKYSQVFAPRLYSHTQWKKQKEIETMYENHKRVLQKLWFLSRI